MDTPRRRLSPLRLIILLAVTTVAGAVVWFQVAAAYSRISQPAVTTWFAPYVDATLAPSYDFEDPLVSPSRYSVLGFVVAGIGQPCQPTWGTYFNLTGAEEQLDLDRRIVKLRERGGDVIVSFGGAANTELSVGCTSMRKLVGAYRTVINRYGVRTIDFDIEGADLTNAAANARRAAAVRTLQQAADRAGRPLAVWLTLPVAPSGLDSSGLAVVNEMLSAGVKLTGVNAMIMDYGSSLPAGESMATANGTALRGLFRQLKLTYHRHGQQLTSSQVWERMGATPMIGQNDVPGEAFSLSDARALVTLARQVHLGRVSMWSANRDYPCGSDVNGDRVSNVCSGVAQSPLEFAWEFDTLDAPLPGHVSAPAGTLTDPPPSRDNPLTSPYGIWAPALIYTLGDKVVWQGEVYEAKWWNQASVPNQPVAHPWDTPWRDLGPVLPSDTSELNPSKLRTPGSWAASQVYLAGDRVIYHGQVFQARWWTQDQEPIAQPLRPAEATWVLVPRTRNHAGNLGKHKIHAHGGAPQP